MRRVGVEPHHPLPLHHSDSLDDVDATSALQPHTYSTGIPTEVSHGPMFFRPGLLAHALDDAQLHALRQAFVPSALIDDSPHVDVHGNRLWTYAAYYIAHSSSSHQETVVGMLVSASVSRGDELLELKASRLSFFEMVHGGSGELLVHARFEPEPGSRSTSAASSRRSSIASEPDTTSEPVYDVANIGDGVASRFVTGFIADARKQVPAENRSNPLDARGRFNLLTIGSRPSGLGRAYTKDVGYAGNEPTNLLGYQMEFTRGNPVPIDAEMLKLTRDIEERRLDGRRPYQFQHPYNDFGRQYSLGEDDENPYSVARFYKAHSTSRPFSERDGMMLRRTYHEYVAYAINKALVKSHRVHAKDLSGEVIGLRYHPSTQLFELDVNSAQGRQTVKARNVVLATGHEGDGVPGFLVEHAKSEHVYSGERITTLTAKIREQPEAFRERDGLIIGSGLSMNDVARTLQEMDCSRFSVVSRHGYTHELPQNVPAMPELEGPLSNIYDALDLRVLFSQSGGSFTICSSANGVERFVEEVKAAFNVVKEAIAGYDSERDRLNIRGQEFDPQQVTRALLSQYALFRYESLRGHPLREALGNEKASEVVRRLLEEVDKPNAAWITSCRTSTTDDNIACNRKLRDNQQLLADEIEGVAARDQGFKVQFKSGTVRNVDYIVNCTGRPLQPDSGLGGDSLTRDLSRQGLIRPHPLGLGVDMDASGRAIPEPERFEAGHRPNLFVASLVKAKGELIFPINRERQPLSNTAAESVLALRPLAREIGRAIVSDLTAWKHLADRDKDFIYGATEVTVEER